MVVTWDSVAVLTSDSATGRAKAREETERRRGIENLILRVRISLDGAWLKKGYGNGVRAKREEMEGPKRVQ